MTTQIRDTGSGAAGNRATDGGEVELLMRGAIEVDIDRARSLLTSSAAKLGDLIRGIEKPDARPPKLEWTSAEVAVHLVQTFRYDLSNVEGTSTPYPVVDGKVLASGAKQSEQRIAEEPERDPQKLADLFDKAVADFLEGTAGRDPLQPVTLAEGHAMTLANLVATVLGEVLVHGYDIAQAQSKPWKMDPEAARVAVYATTATLPLGINPETTADIDVRLNVRIRGGQCFAVHIANGKGWSEECGRADATISADAATFMLVGFGRMGPLGPALKGKILAWGRKPYLAARLSKYTLPI